MISPLSLACCMPWNNSISLTWHMFGYISGGGGQEGGENMATAAFFRDLRAWGWILFILLLIFPSSLSILLWTLTSCFRDDVVTPLQRGPHTPQWRINTIHVFFPRWCVTSSAPYHCAHPWMCLTLVLSPVFPSRWKGRISLLHSTGEATSASDDEVTAPRLLYIIFLFFTEWLCFLQLLSFRLFSVNVKSHSTRAFLCCNIDF